MRLSPRSVLLRLRSAWGDRRTRLRLCALAAAAVFGVLLFRGLKQGGALGGERENDFAAYHGAARAVLRGNLAPAIEDPSHPYQYPPTLAVLVAPLGLLPRPAAAFLWTIGNLAVFLLAFRGLDRILLPAGPAPGSRAHAGRDPATRVEAADKVLGLLLVCRAAENDFANGNANTLVLGIVLQGLSLQRRGRAWTGGLLLGLAAAVKVTPIFLVCWDLLRGRWRSFLGALLGLALAGVLLPTIVLGPAGCRDAWRGFHGTILRPLDPSGEGYREEAPGGYLPGQSLRPLLHRLLRASDATANDAAEVRVNLLDLSKGTVDGIYLSLASALTLSLLCRFRRAPKEGSSRECGAALAALALLSPLSRTAHFVLLLPAAAAGARIWRAEGPGRRRKWMAALWWGAFTLAALTSPAILGRELSRSAMAYCPLGLAALLLILLLTTRE